MPGSHRAILKYSFNGLLLPKKTVNDDRAKVKTMVSGLMET